MTEDGIKSQGWTGLAPGARAKSITKSWKQETCAKFAAQNPGRKSNLVQGSPTFAFIPAFSQREKENHRQTAVETGSLINSKSLGRHPLSLSGRASVRTGHRAQSVELSSTSIRAYPRFLPCRQSASKWVTPPLLASLSLGCFGWKTATSQTTRELIVIVRTTESNPVQGSPTINCGGVVKVRQSR